MRYGALGDLVARHAARRSAALVAGGRTMPYGLWLERATRLATALRHAGMPDGARVVAWLPNGHAAALWELGAALSGVAFLALAPGVRREELARVMAVARPTVLVYAADLWSEDAEAVFGRALAAGQLQAVAVDADSPADSASYGLRPAVAPTPGAARGPDEAVRLFATSGTTHSPKFVVHRQTSVAWHARHAADALGLGPDDVVLCVLPLSGVFGHTTFWTAVAAGARVVLMPTFDARQCAEAIQTSGATCLFASDAMLRRLLVLPGAAACLSTLRWAGFAAFNGAAKDLVDQAQATLGLRLFQVYGSTEAQALVATWSPDDPPSVRAQAGGRLVDPDLEARVVDPTSRAPLPPGATGELEMRGRSVFAGYLDNPQASEAALDADGGWYRSGDLVRLGPGRSLVFLGRLRDSLRLGGYLVDPREIEEVLCAHPAVREAQVVSGAEPGHRDVAVAFVRLDRATSENELRAWCERRVARYKVPRRFVAIERFPIARGPNGDKVQRAVLRAWARAGRCDEERKEP